MDLTKLLAVGRSLKESKTVFGKYKLAQQSLPRFVSTVRPSGVTPVTKALIEKANSVVAPAATPAPVIEAVKTKAVVQPKLEVKERVVEAPSAPEKTQKIPVGTISKRTEEPVLKRDPVTLKSRLGEKISAITKKLRSAKKSPATHVQTEWPLGKVQVVRNDLNDADLEIVAPKIRKRAAVDGSTQGGLSQAKNYGYQWMKKTADLFKSASPFEKSAGDPVEKGVAEKTDTPVETESKNRAELVDQL